MQFISIFLLLFFMMFGFTKGERFTKKFGNRSSTIIVDPSDDHNRFSSIQAAINFVPSNNRNWISIFVKAGVYNEQVTIPQDKPFIYIRGEGIGKTKVVWDAHEYMLTSATFTSLASNIVVSGITFVNSYNYPPSINGPPVKQALAARISGDKIAFYECSFLGFQDTLLDDNGRHFFKLCTIEGYIDFIFGGGQSIYEECRISVNAGSIPVTTGAIVAQGRSDPNDSNGFIFRNCNVTGKGKAFLGRAWKPYSRVLYYNSFLSDVVHPQGWNAWTYVGHEDNITFIENSCRGPGSNKLKRVKWEKQLSPNELHWVTGNSYIDNEGWMRRLPLRILN